MRKNKICGIFIAIFINLIFAKEGLAYLDPGSGSYLLQLLLGALLGGLFALKVFWGRITAFFKSFFNKMREKR